MHATRQRVAFEAADAREVHEGAELLLEHRKLFALELEVVLVLLIVALVVGDEVAVLVARKDEAVVEDDSLLGHLGRLRAVEDLGCDVLELEQLLDVVDAILRLGAAAGANVLDDLLGDLHGLVGVLVEEAAILVEAEDDLDRTSEHVDGALDTLRLGLDPLAERFLLREAERSGGLVRDGAIGVVRIGGICRAVVRTRALLVAIEEPDAVANLAG